MTSHAREIPTSPERITEAFRRLLLDEVALYAKTRALEANTRAELINGVFAEQARQLDEVVEQIAGVLPTPVPRPVDHVRLDPTARFDAGLLLEHQRIVEELRNLVDLFSEWEEPDHQAFVSCLLHEHETMSWGLRSLIARQPRGGLAPPVTALPG
ncbi:MAG: hypothetical protein IAE78_24410 [Myxococcus sp.]|nr:hypothetical protein [Myxococcus sp.]